MKTLRTLAKIMTVALILCLVFSFAACKMFKGSLKLEAFVVDRSTIKTVYYIGEEIDFTGIKATVRYSDESLNTVYTFGDLKIEYDADITATEGTKQVRVSFMDPHLNVTQETFVQITVREDPNAIKHESFAVDASGMKTTYFVGDVLDFTGVKVVEKFTNGGADVEMTDMSKVSYEYDAATITASTGTKSVLVKYNGESAGSISVTVKYPAVTASQLNTEGVTLEYVVGDTVSFAGLKAELTYENGQSSTVTDFVFVTDLATLTEEYGTKTVIVKIDDEISGTTVNQSFEVKVDGVVEYVFNTEAVKLSYLIGDTVSLEGLLVTEDWYFASDVSVPFSALSFDVTADTTAVAGQKSVNVSYNGNVIGKVNLVVKIPNVKSVVLNTEGMNTEYRVGQTVSIEGLTALITYENDVTKIVDAFTAVTDLANLTAEPGDKSVVVAYVDPISGNSANDTVVIKVDGIVGYTLDTSNVNLNYLENETISFEGVKVSALYYYGDVVEIPFASLTFTHEDNLTAVPGNKTVTVSVGATEVGSFIIAVGDIPVASLNTENVDLSYRVGETVSLDGLTLILTYSDGTPAQTVTDFEVVTNLANLTATAGEKTIAVKYLFDGEVELSAQFTITVHGFTYKITNPTKTEYIAGDALDYAGFKVEKDYNDGGELVLVTDYVLEDSGVTATAGNKIVLVKVGGVEIGSISLTVKQNVVTSETLANTVSSVRLGSTVDFSGITLTVTYLDGSTVVLSGAELTVNADLATAGTKTVEVSYYDAVNKVTENVSFTLTVYGIDHYGIDTSEMQTSYIVGQTINYNGLKVYAYYNDGGEPALVSASKITFGDEGASATPGVKSVPVFVDGKNTNVAITVTVLKNEIASVDVSGYKEVYEKDETADFSGVTVTVTYLDGSTVTLTASDLTFGELNTATGGNKEVTFKFLDAKNNEDYSGTFKVEVKIKPSVTALEKPDTLSAFDSDNKSAGTHAYGDSQFSGEFLVGTDLYVIGDDNAFIFLPTVTVEENGTDKDLYYFYADVDLYVHNGTDYVLLNKTALNRTVYEYRLDGTLYATVDTYRGEYQFASPLNRVKLSVKPAATDYKNTESFPAVTLEAKVIDAYNAYNALDLSVIDASGRQEWADFKADKGYAGISPAGIVLHNDITIRYTDVPSEFFYKSTETVRYYNTVTGKHMDYYDVAGMNYLIDETILYSRYGTSNFVIQGNFFTISTADFPLVASPSIFGEDAGKDYGSDYSNAALFEFETIADNYVSDDQVTARSYVTIENVAFIGNAGRDSWVVEKVHGEDVTSTTELVTAGGLILVKSTRHSVTTLNNVINNSFFIVYMPNTEGDIYLNGCKSYDSYQNTAFVWGASIFEANNSFFNGTGGPVVIAQSVLPDGMDVHFDPIVRINNTEMDTSLSGDEIWFKAVGATGIIGQVKANGAALGQAGLGNWVSGDKMNIKGALMNNSDNAADALTDVYVQGGIYTDGAGLDRFMTSETWMTILTHPALAQGAPFLVVHDQAGNAYVLYHNGTNLCDLTGRVFDATSIGADMSNPSLGTLNHAAIYQAFATADEITLHQGGLSVLFEFYH